MADTIDELKIEVEADAGNASGAIDGLINDITRLSESVGKLNTNKLGKLQTSLEAIGKIKFDSNFSGLQGISNLLNSMANMPNASDFTRLANGISKLNQADSSNIQKLSGDIDTLSKAMNGLRSGNSYNTNIDMGKIAPTSDEVANTEQFSESLNSVNESLSSSENSIHVYIDEMGNMSESIKDAAESEGELQDATDSVSESANSTNESVGSSSQTVYTLNDALKTTTSALKSFGSALLSVGSGIVKADFSMISGTLEAAGNAASSLAEKIGDVAKGIGDIVVQSSPLGTIPELFRSIGNASDSLERKLRKVVNLFTMMAVRKAYTAVFNEMGTAFEHLSAESESVSSNMETLSNAMSTLAHNITAAAEPLLNIFGPALEYIINLLNTAIVYVNQFLAALSGKRYVSVATASISTYSEGIETLAEDAEDATEANKKLNKQLQGFNELNNLTTTETSSGSGGSGGSGAGGEGVGGYYEDIDIASDIQDFVDKLLEAWENSDFTEIGNILGEKLKEALESIPWDEIQYYAEKIAHSLATLINGFIETEGLGETIGNTLGEAINTALIFADEFLTTLHWDNLGIFVADIVNGAIDSVEWELLGKTLGDALSAWLEYGFNFITNIEWGDLGQNVAIAVNEFVDIVNETLTSADYDWSEVGRGIANGLNDAFADIEWDDIGEMVGNGMNVILDNISGFIDDFDFGSIGTDIADALNASLATIHWDELGITIRDGINGIFSSVNNWSAEFDFGSFGNDIATAINNALNGITWSDAITAAKNIGSGIAEAINNVMTPETFSNIGSTIAGVLNTAIAGVGSFLDDTNFYQLGQSVAAGINQWLADMDFKEMGRTLGKVLQSAIDFLAGLIDGLTWSDVKKALEDFFSGMAEEVNMGTVGEILAAALAVWLTTNLVSSVVSGVGTALGLNLALSLSGVLAEGISMGSFAAVTAAIAALLVGAIAGVTVNELTGGPEALVDAISDCVSEACEKLDDLSKPGGALYEFGEAFRKGFTEVWEATLGKLGIHLPSVEEELEEDQPEGETSDEYDYELGINVKTKADEESVQETKEYINENLPGESETDVTIVAAKLIDNIDDEEKVIKCLGQIYTLIFGENLTDEEIEGLTGVIDYLKTNGQLTVENVIATVTMYGYLTEIYDETTSDQRKLELIGQIKQLLVDSGVKEVDDLEGVITTIINECDNPLDAIARIYDYLIEHDLLPEIDTEANVTSVDTSDVDGEETVDVTANADELETAEIEGEEVDVVADAEELDTSDVEGEGVDVTGDVTDLNETHLSDRELAVYGRVTDLINGNYDNRVDCIAEIIKMITGSDATSQQISGVTAIIDDLESKGELTAENVIAEIMKLLVPDGTSINADVEADDVFVPEGYYVDLDGNIHKLSYDQTDPIDVEGNMTVDKVNVPDGLTLDGVIAYVTQALSNGSLSLSGLAGYISQAIASGQLSLSDVRALISSLVANGSLSLSDVSAMVSAIEAATGLKLNSPVYATKVDANGNSVSAPYSITKYSDTPTPSGNFKIGGYSSTPVPTANFKIGGYSSIPVPNAKYKISAYSSIPVPNAKYKISAYSSVPVPYAKYKIKSYSNSPTLTAKYRIKSYVGAPTVSAPGRLSSLSAGGCSVTLRGAVSTSGSTAVMRLRAKKGAIFQGGKYLGIPHFASGTDNAGSLFIAGEAGPELVGHVGSRTEVLNASQLATVMTNAIVAGMATLGQYLDSMKRQMVTNTNGIINAIVVCYGSPNIMPSVSGLGASSNSRFNDLEEDKGEMIDLLSQIAQNTSETERYQFETDPYNIFKAVRKENNEYRLATGKSAFA